MGLAAAAFLATAGQAAAECALLGTEPAVAANLRPRAFAAEFAGDVASAVLVTLADGAPHRIELERLRPGQSHRMTLFSGRGTEPYAVFTLATTEPGGTLLVETWVQDTSPYPSPPPRRSWFRLRCAPPTPGDRR